MDKWQECTLRGNTEFNRADYGNAILLHNQAPDCAHFHFEEAALASPDRTISKVIISALKIKHEHLLKFHEGTVEINQQEARHAICH